MNFQIIYYYLIGCILSVNFLSGQTITYETLAPKGDRPNAFKNLKLSEYTSDGLGIIGVLPSGSRQVATINGETGPQFSEISNLVASPDGKRLAYIGRKGSTSSLVVDHKIVRSFQPGKFQTIRNFTFSPDGKEYAYFLYQLKATIIEGYSSRAEEPFWKPEPHSYRSVSKVSYRSSDGAMFHFAEPFAKVGNELWELWKNGKRVMSIGDDKKVGTWGITSDGKTLFAIIEDLKNKDSRQLLLNETMGPVFRPPYDWKLRNIEGTSTFVYEGDSGLFRNHEMIIQPGERMRDFATSDDGLSVAYTKKTPGGEMQTVVFNGEESFEYSEIKQLRVSPDGSRVAFVGEANGRDFVIVDGEESEPFMFVKDLQFSPKGNRYTYSARNADGYFIVVDGEKYGPSKSKALERSLTFSPDGSRFAGAFERRVKESGMIVVDGERKLVGMKRFTPRNRGAYQPYFVFSEDAKRLAYLFWVSGVSHTQLSLGGQIAPIPVTVGSKPTFSPDGKYFALAVYDQAEGPDYYVSVNGQKVGPAFDSIPDAPEKIKFLDNSRFQFLALKEGDLVRVTVDMAGAPMAANSMAQGSSQSDQGVIQQEQESVKSTPATHAPVQPHQKKEEDSTVDKINEGLDTIKKFKSFF